MEFTQSAITELLMEQGFNTSQHPESYNNMVAAIKAGYILGEQQGRRNLASIERTTYPEIELKSDSKTKALMVANVAQTLSS